MSHARGERAPRGPVLGPSFVALLGGALLQCSGSSGPGGPPPPVADGGDSGGAGDDGGGPGTSACFPDSDGLTGGAYTFALTVDDTGFSKTVLSTQNDATVTLTLTNRGTTPHGFEVGCADVTPVFPNLPAGCPTMSCFPANSMIAPLAPGASATITFFTPTPDLIHPFQSSAPGDATVPGLNDGQWIVM